MKTVFFSKEAQFELQDDEFEAFIKTAQGGKKVWIPRLQVFLSDMFIWAGKKPADRSVGRLHDGTRVIKKFGQWVDANDEKIKIDVNYYPELARDEVMTEEEWQGKKEQKKLA